MPKKTNDPDDLEKWMAGIIQALHRDWDDEAIVYVRHHMHELTSACIQSILQVASHANDEDPAFRKRD